MRYVRRIIFSEPLIEAGLNLMTKQTHRRPHCLHIIVMLLKNRRHVKTSDKTLPESFKSN